jgi:hypothetical protein
MRLLSDRDFHGGEAFIALLLHNLEHYN